MRTCFWLASQSPTQDHSVKWLSSSGLAWHVTCIYKKRFHADTSWLSCCVWTVPPSMSIMEQKWTRRKIHMEIAARKLNLMRLMSLTALPDFCFTLRECRALLVAGWCYYRPPPPPPLLLAGTAQSLFQGGSWGFHGLLSVRCETSQSTVVVWNSGKTLADRNVQVSRFVVSEATAAAQNCAKVRSYDQMKDWEKKKLSRSASCCPDVILLWWTRMYLRSAERSYEVMTIVFYAVLELRFQLKAALK